MPNKIKYTQHMSGDAWAEKNCHPFVVVCCDCGLVHKMVVSIPKVHAGKRIIILCERDNRRTAARRRNAKFIGMVLPKKEGNMIYDVKLTTGANLKFPCGPFDTWLGLQNERIGGNDAKRRLQLQRYIREVVAYYLPSYSQAVIADWDMEEEA
jgi:hypothetical protein